MNNDHSPKKNIIHLCIDLETLSLQPDAAIIQMVALPFNPEEPENIDHVTWTHPDGQQRTLDLEPYYCSVNATTCALYGMHFDMDTVRWWSQASSEAKMAIYSARVEHIHDALEGLVNYLQSIRNQVPDSQLRIWTQGTDFDVPILRSAFFRVLSMADTPWHRTELRDARTYCLTVLELMGADMQKPYDFLDPYRPKEEAEWVRHDALLDARRTAINVALCHRFLSPRFSDAASCG